MDGPAHSCANRVAVSVVCTKVEAGVDESDQISEIVGSLDIAVSDAGAGKGSIRGHSCRHVEDHLVDIRVTGSVILHVNVGLGHVDSSDVDGHWIIGHLEVVRVLVHAEAARVALLEHVLKLGS